MCGFVSLCGYLFCVCVFLCVFVSVSVCGKCVCIYVVYV